MSSVLNLVAVGALGQMLSPAAEHLVDNEKIKITKVLDSSKSTPLKQARRLAWLNYGAEVVASIDLLFDSSIDGVIICAGKNNSDSELIKSIVKYIKQRSSSAFILHFSTVSQRFVNRANIFCNQQGVEYVNWPLTGGPSGAKSASMLVLASGNHLLYQKTLPLLQSIGRPHYFDDKIETAVVVKLVSHSLVFASLLGYASAIQLYSGFSGCNTNDLASVFDFVNQGAGGSRQWNLAFKLGLAGDQWDVGFMLEHAVVDALYTVDLLLEQNMAKINILPILLTATSLALLINEYGTNWATQKLTHLLQKTDNVKLDDWLEKTIDVKDISGSVGRIINTLPKEIQEQIKLKIDLNDFQ